MAKVKKIYYPNKKDKPRRINTVCKLFRIFYCTMFGIIRYYLDYLIDYVFGLYYNSQVQRVQEATNPLILESATSLAKKIAKREATSLEIVTAFVERIKEVNPLINAVVDNRFEEALKEAAQIDLDIATGQIIDADFRQKPFLGVPITAKESTAVKGLSHTFGLFSRKGKVSNYDADIVESMKKAGAIVLAVTNVPQLNLWQETSNPLYGLTSNPYNTTRNVGGSSGGEASIIAAGGSPLGLGTDIGGSTRIPAFMCGLFGHKPTSGLISTRGMTFRNGKEKVTMVVPGPLSRHCEDLTTCLEVLLESNADKLKLRQEVDVRSIKVYFIGWPNDPTISPQRAEMKRAMVKAVKFLREEMEDAPLEVVVPELRSGGQLWRFWMTQESDVDFKKDLTNRESEIGAIKEIFKYFAMSSQYTLAVIFSLINGLLPKVKERWAKETTDSLHTKLIEILGTNGVLLYPCSPWPASYHHTAFLRPWNFNLFSIWNVLKFPVTQVPLGLSKEGLPLGVQVVAAPYHDHLALAVAKLLEKGFGGHVPPFTLKK